MKGINEIIEEIYYEKGEYMKIVIKYSYEKRYEILSELCLSFLERAKAIEAIYTAGYFLYYFSNVVKYQVKSSTSSFHKNCRIKEQISADSMIDIIDDNEIRQEDKINIISDALSSVKTSYFDAQMFKHYYFDNMTYRQIEAEFGVDHCLVYHSIKKTLKKIKKQIEKKDIY